MQQWPLFSNKIWKALVKVKLLRTHFLFWKKSFNICQQRYIILFLLFFFFGFYVVLQTQSPLIEAVLSLTNKFTESTAKSGCFEIFGHIFSPEGGANKLKEQEKQFILQLFQVFISNQIFYNISISMMFNQLHNIMIYLPPLWIGAVTTSTKQQRDQLHSFIYDCCYKWSPNHCNVRGKQQQQTLSSSYMLSSYFECFFFLFLISKKKNHGKFVINLITVLTWALSLNLWFLTSNPCCPTLPLMKES